MREAERHNYLQLMGIDAYVLRARLPEEIQQEIIQHKINQQEINEVAVTNKLEEMNQIENNNQSEKIRQPFSSLLDETLNHVKVASVKIEQKKVENFKSSISNISSFSLSIWRPRTGMLVIDSRDMSLALPTEFLLGNILRAYFNHADFSLGEEVLQWPMSGIKGAVSQHNAKVELQTWLSVEHEQRPIQTLWLMGKIAVRLWLPQEVDYEEAAWTQQKLKELNVEAFILPSLNEFLQQPLYKSKLWNIFSHD